MKSVEEIYQELLEAFSQRTGLTLEDSCELSVRLWAAAAQIQALQIQADWVLDQSFPQTAQGVYLERHGAMRGISRTPAAKAEGTLRFCVTTPQPNDLQIPAGTVCMTAAAVRYETLSDTVLAAGELSADAPAQAMEGGSAGNAGIGAVCVLTACPVAVTSVTNPTAFVGGSDEEDDEALRQRILESYQRLPNGANAAWYEQTALSHEGVAAAKAVGRARGIGTVDVYVAQNTGAPDEDLLEALQTEFAQKREIAVDVLVKAPTLQQVDVTLSLAVRDGVDFEEVRTAAEQVIANYFSGALLGKPVLLAELGNRIYALEDVENYAFSAPAADLAADSTVLPVLGTLQVTKMEA